MNVATFILAILYTIYDSYFLGRFNVDCDFDCYYRAAKNDFEIRNERPDFIGWCYAKWLRYTWKPFLLLSPKTAAIVWKTVLILSYAYLLSFFWGVNYGWILILASIKPFALVIRAGNVSAILAVLLLNPVGAAIACLFKPYLFPFVVLHVFRNEILAWF